MATPLLALAPLVFDGARKVLDRLFPDPEQRAAAELELLKLKHEGDFEQRAGQALALAQIEVNKADAAGSSPMQRNWRPMVGWVCAGALAWDSIARPMVSFAWVLAGHPVPQMPSLANEQIYGLLFALLGLGTLRTVEKVRGTQ